MKFKLAFLTLVLLSVGVSVCAESPTLKNINNYQKESAKSKPRIIKTDNFEDALENLIKEGYIPIKSETYSNGAVFFNYDHGINELQKNARNLGAQIVLFSKSDDYSTSLVTDYSLSNFRDIPQTHKDFESYNDNSQTYINGSLTRSSMRSVNSTEYEVSYFSKFNSATGIYPKDLSDKEKNKMGLTTGVEAITISARSPADGQILKNDIILKIGNDNIMNMNSFIESSNNLKKGFIFIEILRKGQKMTKIIALNE
ncbi:PDZ domain-containing protein [Acinetobacter piscicola]|uniref:PDZ domain-containing protein n=1 Tax=Acinetobacter piscicola TaxID=2006115 RepID=UPI001E2E53CD|nr:PDZ domain-containing protein [Acinetobacter piscicola]